MPEPFFKSPWAEDEKLPQRKIASPQITRSRGTTTFPVLPLLIGGVAILVIGVGAFLTLRLVGQKAEEATIELSAPKEILLGQPFILTVKIENNGENLKDGKLSVFLPPEMNLAGESPTKRVHQELIGSVEKFSSTKREVRIVVASGTERVSRIQAKFSYTQPGASAQFERSDSLEILIGPPAVSLDFATPENILSGGNFDVKLTINNRTNQDIDNLSLSLAFPKNYSLVSSTPATSATSTWFFDNLKRGEVKTLIITGNLIGQESDFLNMTASLRRRERDEEYVVGEKTASLSITAPPLALIIRPSISGNAVHLGEAVPYSVILRNNTAVSLENVMVKVALVGELFNMSSIQTTGLVNPVSNSIVWNPTTAPGLLRLPPGETQTLNFTVLIKNRIQINRTSDKNYTLKINGTAESPTPIPNVSSQKTVVLGKSETKVAGFINLQTQAYRKDPTGKFVNSGPYPPRANQPSQYTVRWTLRNYATDMSRIEVSSYLEPYSRLVGKPISNISSTPIYNSASGQVVWRINAMPATQGALGAPIEAVFQIEATPPNPYIGHDATLLRPTTLRATDDFIGQEFSLTIPALLTNLPDDQSLGNLDRTVQP